MPRKVLEGCQWGSAVPRTVLAPLTGPQEMVIDIYFREGFAQPSRVVIPAGPQVNVPGRIKSNYSFFFCR
jgi:hypothetical protein